MFFLWKAVFRAPSHSLPLPAPLAHFLAFLSSVDQSSDAALSSFSLPVALGSFCIRSAHCYPAYGHTGASFSPIVSTTCSHWGDPQALSVYFHQGSSGQSQTNIFFFCLLFSEIHAPVLERQVPAWEAVAQDIFQDQSVSCYCHY